ncbi:MAG: alpha/beta fold hydrolase [Gammaproteobacteria bacterium]|nr:alpha/beta hydrolase [Gammaproteobacteria bacterium]NIP89880.1 alpha/beta hydrolase [Gammaproteobacteria bacterium]NIR24743.1 alpha/beta hydrolase [Gammaproteobacteria bacterium]NIS05090.1 alpha/beta hydrolase [Gammaproteobacteria bacterium]NIU42496.1 alpha/beta fold hydrolase [Gammaproteobacteria bacterium]
MLKLLLMGAAIYAMLCLAIFLFQPRLVYFPMKAMAATPAAIGLRYEDVILETAAGTTVHGWYLPGRENARTLLFLHGNAGNISHRLDSLHLFHQLGLNVLIIDYSGFGRSGGKPGEQQTYEDARLAWRYLTDTRGVAPARIVIFGRSLGGGVATWLASRETPGGLILESSFTSVPALARKYYPIFPMRWLARIRYDNASRLPQVRCPVLIAHSRDDEIVPIEHGRALFALARDPKRFLEMRGGHNGGFLVSGESYRAGLARFIADLDSGSAPAARDPAVQASLTRSPM